MMMRRRDDGIKLIEVDWQGDRCSVIIQGFREDDGGKRGLEGKTTLGVNNLLRFVDGNEEGKINKFKMKGF